MSGVNYAPFGGGHDAEPSRVLLSSLQPKLLPCPFLFGLSSLALLEVAQLVLKANPLCEKLGTFILQGFDELIVFTFSLERVDWLCDSIWLLGALLILRWD